MTDWFGNYTWPLPTGVDAPDFAYWGRMPEWHLEEGVSLALGAEPRSAKRYVETGLRSFTPGDNKKQSFEVACEMLLELACRNFSQADDGSRVLKDDFVDWLQSAELPFPSELRSALKTIGNRHVNWRKIVDDKEEEIGRLKLQVNQFQSLNSELGSSQTPRTIERESLLKLVIGMAVKGYAYDPKPSRSSIPKEISDDLALIGISLSDDTVRKYLKLASDYLPPKQE